MRGLADRTAVEDIKPLAATLIQSEQLGAQIGPALRASSDALRTRRRLHAEEEAQKASIKILFPLVIFVLPCDDRGNHRTGNDLGHPYARSPG